LRLGGAPDAAFASRPRTGAVRHADDIGTYDNGD
jgi:hypothetical protein